LNNFSKHRFGDLPSLLGCDLAHLRDREPTGLT